MVQFKRRLHAVEIVELDECKTAAFLGLVLFRENAHCCGRVLLEVFLHGLGVGGVGEVSC